METLDVTETEFGTVYLVRRQVPGVEGDVYEILIGDEVLMTSLSPVSERGLSSRALAMHEAIHGTRGDLRVLVGGLGLGYTAHAALADCRVSQVHVIEKMPFVIEWMKSGYSPVASDLSVSPRVHVRQADCYELLLGPPSDTFDLILIDIDHSPDARLSEASAPFYTATGQRHVAEHLRPGGILGVWSIEPCERFVATLAEVYESCHSEEVTWQDPEFPEADYENTLFFARRG